MLTKNFQPNCNKQLFDFLYHHGNSLAKLHVLLFWGRHPDTKFTLECITYALDAIRLDLREAVQALVEEEIISTECSCNGNIWYSLAKDDQIRECIDELARLSWDRLRYLYDYHTGKVIAGYIHS